MPGEVSCIFTKALIPWVEREVGPEGAAAILQLAGRPREYLAAEYNSLPLPLADEIARLVMRLMGEADEDGWARRYAEAFMDWKPSRDERSWAGAYTMSYGSPRAIYARNQHGAVPGFRVYAASDLLELRASRARYRFTVPPGVRVPRWACTWIRVCFERYPTNWGLPRARIVEQACAAAGDDACIWEIHWRNPPLGARFWAPVAAGAGASALALAAVARGAAFAGGAAALMAALPALLGAAIGSRLLGGHRQRGLQRSLDLVRDELLHSSLALEGKFRDLEGKVRQLSLLIDLSRAVNATLDTERIYDQALDGLVDRMGYQGAHVFLVDDARSVLRAHRTRGWTESAGGERSMPLDPGASATARVALTGAPVLVNDVDDTAQSVHLPTVRALGVRAFVAVPLRVRERVIGVLNVVSDRPGRFTEADVELLTAVANQVATAIEKAESFRTIEDLSRGLEDKVRVRTEQLGAANEELQAAYRELQAAQMQLVQREKMASVGQLVAGVAHELNNPIGFVSSNAATLEDFVGRLRAMLESYRARDGALPAGDREALQAEWERRKVDYALRYLDSMIQGIREGAERTRKIVRDLRVFARADDDAWQPVDLHEELESSLTLLNHLLKDRVTVHRKFGDLPAVECLRSQIDQVFLNLLANAAQAIQGSGAITIETRRDDGRVLVAIADTGPGIAPDVIGRIFDPFFTTKPVGEGTGLGLSISYEIVKKHGGEIRVDSRPGEGATFTVTLPIARATPAAEPPRHLAPEAGGG